MSIENRSPSTGRFLRENDTVVNLAEVQEAMLAALQALVAASGGPMTRNVIGYETVTIGLGAAPAVGLADVPVGTRSVLLSVRGGDVRFRADGTDPTPGSGGEGHLYRDSEASLELRISEASLADLKFIRGGNTAAVVTVTYFDA